ncbi:MAG: hypothetical protein HUU46_17015 [Candidatus Hydrogenedentes bacterium]|nr:hypothetical protein [Candidatus Hydrogenedentota bacterium]
MNAALERIEHVVCVGHAAALKRDWRGAHAALRACADFAELHRPPEHAEYSPAELIARVARSAGRPVEVSGGRAPNLAGDIERIASIARALLRSAVLEHDALLCANLVECDTVPAWRFSIDGPGRFPDRIDFGFDLTLTFSECEALWTCATRGGRIDSRKGELDLRLKGVRACPDVPTGCESIITALRAAEQHARILATEEFASADMGALHDCLNHILNEFDAQDDSLAPCDPVALVREAIPAAAPDDVAPLHVTVAPGIPPILVRRNRIARLFRTLGALGRAALTHGGSMRLEITYDAPQRIMSLSFQLSGAHEREAVEMYLPSVHRGVARHGGEMALDSSSEEIYLLIAIPDEVARALDEWLPGWDTFAPRSIQMLRLLKSGGPVPPEELILGGVLEDELERRLLPRLGVAPAATLVHELTPRSPALTSSSAQRIEKVLSQLKRGRPKKEICAPAYAAEILWMFSVDARHAAAIGIRDGALAEVPELCHVLAAASIDRLDALRRIACMVLPPV